MYAGTVIISNMSIIVVIQQFTPASDKSDSTSPQHLLTQHWLFLRDVAQNNIIHGSGTTEMTKKKMLRSQAALDVFMADIYIRLLNFFIWIDQPDFVYTDKPMKN